MDGGELFFHGKSHVLYDDFGNGITVDGRMLLGDPHIVQVILHQGSFKMGKVFGYRGNKFLVFPVNLFNRCLDLFFPACCL